jgi:hypothetical protein
MLEGIELNWVQYQISHSIEMRCNFNFIILMSQNWSLELCGLISLNSEGWHSVLREEVSSYSLISGN